eukprot:gb/GEZN01023189.1/.p2 GENE.gb/GEZN01023189.1/~~gb/GEZN01023189.1/.p2  ORF type:complete len:105 (+),score=10.03 gb/GEZN01023189.1/:148-462(+)
MALRRTTRLLGRMDGYKYNKNGPKPFAGTALWWKSYVPIHGERQEHISPFRVQIMAPLTWNQSGKWWRRVRDHAWKLGFFFGSLAFFKAQAKSCLDYEVHRLWP